MRGTCSPGEAGGSPLITFGKEAGPRGFRLQCWRVTLQPWGSLGFCPLVPQRGDLSSPSRHAFGAGAFLVLL